MNVKDIAALAEIVRKNELTKLEINGEHIVIEREPAIIQTVSAPAAVQTVAEQMHTAEPIAVGDTVQRGDTLCIIEAMKLMNEITSDIDGEIVEICVGNGQVVEYDQPLFRIV